MVTMNQWLHLSVRIHDTKVSYSLLGRLNNFTGTLNHVTGFGLIYVGGVPVAWPENVEKSFQNFTGYIKELLVECKASDSALVYSSVRSASFRCYGACNLSRTIKTNRGKSIPTSKPRSTSRKSPPPTYTTNFIPKKISNTANTTQRLGFLNDSLEVNKIDKVMTNSKKSPAQNTANVSGIAKIYKVTVILIIVLFAAVLLYVLGMIVKNKVQQYRAKLHEERQLDMGRSSDECLGGGGAEDRNSFHLNRTSNLCDIETGTNINEQQTNRFWRERGERLTVQGNQLRMSASTQSLMSNVNDMESANQVKFWREGTKKGIQKHISSSTHSLSSRRSSAPVCESSLFVTPRLLRKREGTSSKEIPRVLLTCAQDEKVVIKRENPLKSIHGRATNTFININGKMPDKTMKERSNEQEGMKSREGKYKSFKNADKIQGFEVKPNANAGKMSYKWAYIRADSETECSENERARQSSKTNRCFDATFRPCSLRILETNESEEEEETCNKNKNYDEFQTFRCRSSDNICRGRETMKISYDPCLSSSQGERLVCFGIHSASSDPSVVSSSRANLMCDCSIQQRHHSSYHDTASVDSEWDSRQHLDAFLDSFLYNKGFPADIKNGNCTSHLQENDGHRSKQSQPDKSQSFMKTSDGRTDIKLLGDSKKVNVPEAPSPPPLPPLPPSSLQVQQKRRQQLQLIQLPSFVISKEEQIDQQNNVIGQRGRLLRQPKVDLTIPRPHSSCNFTRTDDDEEVCHPIRMTHASSCDSIPRWVVTPASSKNSKESVDDSACAQQNKASSQQGVNGTKTQECEKRMSVKSRDVPVANSNGLDNSAQRAKISTPQIARETNTHAFKKPLPDSSRDVPDGSSNGVKNPWILRPNMLSKNNEQGSQRKVFHTKHQGNRWHPRQGAKPKSSLIVTANNKDDEEGERKVWKRSSWTSGNRPSEFELALKGTVPVKRPPSNASVLLKVPGSRARPQSETMF